MARVCDFSGCDNPAAVRIAHPNHGEVDICKSDKSIFPDDAEILEEYDKEQRQGPEPDNPGSIVDY